MHQELERFRPLIAQADLIFQWYLPDLYVKLEKPLRNIINNGSLDTADITPQQIKCLFQLHLNTIDQLSRFKPQGKTENQLRSRATTIEDARKLVETGINFETPEGKEAALIWLEILARVQSKKMIHYHQRSSEEAETVRIQKTLADAREIIQTQ